MTEFLELIDEALDPGFWYLPNDVKECLFWSKRVKLLHEEPPAPLSYKEDCGLEITEGGAIMFNADCADIKDNKLPVDDCRSNSIISGSTVDGNWSPE